MKCWASSLGNCGEKQSGEYLVSNGLFESPQVSVQGFPWCKDQPKVIGLSRLTSNILCTYHNNALSDTDGAAAQAFSAMREATRLYNTRAKQPAKRWTTRTFSINGENFERWSVKTTINLSLSKRSSLKWLSSAFAEANPPEILIRAAFGLSELPSHCGLYAASKIGGAIASEERVAFAPLIEDQTFIVGGLLEFRGHRFVLWLHESPPPPTLAPFGLKQPDWQGAQLHYHLEEIEYALHGRPTAQLLFRW
jgi:hypothetical protein